MLHGSLIYWRKPSNLYKTMNKILENNSSLVPKNDTGDILVPDGIKTWISSIGVKGGQKYSDFVDSVVDLIFKKNK